MTRAQLVRYADHVGENFGLRSLRYLGSVQTTARVVLVDDVSGVAHTLEWSEKARAPVLTTVARRGKSADYFHQAGGPDPSACAVGMDAIVRFEGLFGQPFFEEVGLELLAAPDDDAPPADVPEPVPLFP